MNSLAHSIPKLSMKWTPSLIHPNKGTFGELNCSHSACDPPITNYSLIPNPKDLVLQVQTPPTHAHANIEIRSNSLKPRTLAQANPSGSLRLVHLAWVSMKQWLHHLFSLRWAILPERDLIRSNTQISSPRRGFVLNHTQNSSRPRLGEPLSPEWDFVSLNPNLGRLSEKLEPKPWMNSYNSRLGERVLLGQNLQSFATVHAPTTPKPNQNAIHTLPSIG